MSVRMTKQPKRGSLLVMEQMKYIPWVKFRKYFEMRQGQKIHFKVLILQSMRIFFSVEFLVLGAQLNK